MQSKDITITDARFQDTVSKTIKNIVAPEIETRVNKAIEETLIQTGKIVRYYPYLDKAKVKLDSNKKTVLCKILHRYGGDMIDFYTPYAYKQIYDEDLHEPCIIPFAEARVCVLNVKDFDSDEHLILGYYQNEELTGINPAKPGNVKMTSIVPTSVFWFKFGVDGVEYRSPSQPKIDVGDLEKDIKPVKYANSDDTYTKEELYTKDELYTREEVYTKKEVDELIKKAIREANDDSTD